MSTEQEREEKTEGSSSVKDDKALESTSEEYDKVDTNKRDAVMEEMVVAAPKALGILSQFMVLSSQADFFLQKSEEKETEDVTFKGKLLKVTRKALRALNDAHESMFDINSKAKEVPEHVEKIAHILESDNQEGIDQVSEHLKLVEDLSGACAERAKKIADKFDVVMQITNKTIESFSYPKTVMQREKDEIAAKIKSINSSLGLEEDLKAVAEKHVAEMSERVDGAVKLFALASQREAESHDAALEAALLTANYPSMWDTVYAKLPVQHGQQAPQAPPPDPIAAKSAAELLPLCKKILEFFSDSGSFQAAKANNSDTGIITIAAEIEAAKIGLLDEQEEVVSFFDTAIELAGKTKILAKQISDDPEENAEVLTPLKKLTEQLEAYVERPSIIVQNIDAVKSYYEMASSYVSPTIAKSAGWYSQTMGYIAPVATSVAGAVQYYPPTVATSVAGAVQYYSPTTAARLTSAAATARLRANSTAESARAAYKAAKEGTSAMARMAYSAYEQTMKLQQAAEARIKALSTELAKINVTNVMINNVISVLLMGVESLVGVGMQWRSLVHFFQYIKTIVHVTLNSAVSEFREYADKSLKITIKGRKLSDVLKKIITDYAMRIAQVVSEVTILSSAYVKLSNEHMVNKLKDLGPAVAGSKQKVIESRNMLLKQISEARTNSATIVQSMSRSASKLFSGYWGSGPVAAPEPVLLGMLQVTVVKATGVRVGDLRGSSDPYAVIVSGEDRQKSPYVSKTLNPVWNHTFPLKLGFDPRKPETAYFKILIYDKDIYFDDYLGEATIVLTADLKHNNTVEKTEKLVNGPGYNKNVTGTVTVKVLIE